MQEGWNCTESTASSQVQSVNQGIISPLRLPRQPQRANQFAQFVGWGGDITTDCRSMEIGIIGPTGISFLQREHVLLEHFVAGLLGVCLGPLVVRLDAAELLLEVPHGGAVGELLLELVCRQLEAPGCDLVGPPVRLVRVVSSELWRAGRTPRLD